ncbi:MAG: hypothetical protein ABIV94_02635 [Acidimicrobiales bacterium]
MTGPTGPANRGGHAAHTDNARPTTSLAALETERHPVTGTAGATTTTQTTTTKEHQAMTITETRPSFDLDDIPKPAPVTTGFAVTAAAGCAALRNALLYVAGDAARPSLDAVRLESDGTTVTIVATDSYCLSRETIGYDEGVTVHEPFTASIPAHVVKQATKAAGRKPHGLLVITVGPADAYGNDAPVTVEVAGATFTGHDPGGFPEWHRLMPDLPADTGDAVSCTLPAFNPKLLARLGKVEAGDSAPVRFRVVDALKPTVVTIGARFTALYMPVRVGA